MAEDRSYIEQNRAALARLRALVDRLSDEQLAQPMDSGLTPALVLAHMAFWDGRSLYLAERWDNGGPGPQREHIEPDDVDWINDAARPLFEAIPPREAARLALATAEAVDRKLEGLSDEQLAQNRSNGSPLHVLRANHRLEHVEELEQALRL